MADQSIVPGGVQYSIDNQDNPAIAIVRRPLKGMERSYVWNAVLMHAPENLQLVLPLRRPFMNFKEARIALAALLDREPKKVKFSAVRGARTYYIPDTELDTLTEEHPPEVTQELQSPLSKIDVESWRSTF